MIDAVTSIELKGVPKVASGKVREIFDLGDHFLFVASDRISAYDVVMPNGIPNKGRVLTQLSRFWFEQLQDVVANHVVSQKLSDLPAVLQDQVDVLDGRFMIVKKCEMFPVECVVRGYLVGGGYAEYRQSGSVCGLPLPAGLDVAERLPEPIFTPARKAVEGHDENISFETAAEMIGNDHAEALRRISIALYTRAAALAYEKGIMIADTKFEFGLHNGEIVLADEVLTPDSSRYWPLEQYRTGANPPSFDKQYVRDYLSGLDWDKTSPGPLLPDHVLQGAEKRYLECFQLITGKSLFDEAS
ncbi:phosphoribosylaminoimidazolesuccinocarboxamide synthase [Acanthopleuribacter pedis]|uniref:Phosphoribosylaminoimidazole-succinocarboxamide synthase n=1 Tax=Acanthopleuribacter pedis TaxID=442870 RepID=A0A8J7U401_9BACT|nr:phosphoribosylaminoimidazolesuccinocarboxamide synthase [Acanthopleuribacter pedis]MBO1317811.1 phosphoribosylaminoimidazolesuccinocarboxamide synthase [Acanthopleuribacter pedis]